MHDYIQGYEGVCNVIVWLSSILNEINAFTQNYLLQVYLNTDNIRYCILQWKTYHVRSPPGLWSILCYFCIQI